MFGQALMMGNCSDSHGLSPLLKLVFGWLGCLAGVGANDFIVAIEAKTKQGFCRSMVFGILRICPKGSRFK
jgi:hypothetical protein